MIEQHLEQTAKDNRIADIADEQFVETQHPYLLGQRPGQGRERVSGAIELEQALMNPCHEMVEMLAPGRQLQAAMEQVHQPGLATADRAPEVQALRRLALTQGVEAVLQRSHSRCLGGIGDVATLGQRLVIKGFRGHAAHGTPSRGKPAATTLLQARDDQPPVSPTLSKAPSLASVSTYR